MAPASELPAKATGRLLSYDGGGTIFLIRLQAATWRILEPGQPACISWVTALADRLGTDLTSLGPLQSSNTVAFRKNQGLRDGLFVVGADKRLVSTEVTVIAPQRRRDIPASHWSPQAGGRQPFLHAHSRLCLLGKGA
jgi:hypothetical protein